MNRQDFDRAAGIAERMDKLESTIFALQGIMNKKSYMITAYDNNDDFLDGVIINNTNTPKSVSLRQDEIATVVFTQDILEYYINTLNLELDELRKSFEEI